MPAAAASSLKGATKRASATKKSTNMTYEDMIKEAILAHGTEARLGLGRPTIKKFILAKHPDTGKLPLASFNAHFNPAITRGEEKGVFLLPKGASGKVKLAAKAKAATVKAQEAKKPVAKKAAAPSKKTSSTATKKSTTTEKTTSKAAPKKATVTKKAASSTSKKSAATKKARAVTKAAATKKTATKKAPVKKAATKKAPAKTTAAKKK